MTELYKTLKLEPYESLKYIQLIAHLLATHSTVEKATIIKNPKSDVFILLICNSRDELSSKRYIFDKASGLFFRTWLAEDFNNCEFEVFDKRHRGDSDVKAE